MSASSELTGTHPEAGADLNALELLVRVEDVHRDELLDDSNAQCLPSGSIRRLRRLLQVLPGGVIVLNPDGHVQECNPAARRITGCELDGRRWRDVVTQIVAPRADDHCDLSLANGRRVNITTCSLGGEPGQVLLINDVTETRDLQDKVANVRRLSEMGAMTAAIAHQIRTPLSTALLYATSAGAEVTPQTMAKLVERLRHLDKLVTDMLCFARKGSMRVERISVCELMQAIRECVPAEELESLTLEAPDELSEDRILGSPDTLQSVFQNLINNARQAIEPGALLINLSVSQPCAGWLRISVSDNGPGISPALGARVFEPFVSSREQGTGLGLSVARRLIESHGGRLELADDCTRGATFYVDLPTLAADPPADFAADDLACAHQRTN